MSENIFSNFYNKVLSFFQAEKADGASAKDQATNRLKLVLMQDRSNLDGATMQKMREQLISVISKYIEIDQEALNLNLEAEGDEIALMLNIPVIRARTPEEIEELELAEIEARKEEIKAALEAEKADECKSEDACDSEDEEDECDEETSDKTCDTENNEDVECEAQDDSSCDESEDFSNENCDEKISLEESKEQENTSDQENNSSSKKSKKSQK